MLNIRETTEADLKDILHVEAQAFGKKEGSIIVELVDGLLNDSSAKPLLSLLAEKDGQAIGHILFTKAYLTPSIDSVSALILAPLAVLPAAQSQGVGGQLIKEGLRLLRKAGVDLVFVLGHPEYYPRHGFLPAGVRGFDAPYPIPKKNADAWMVQELCQGLIGKVSGTVICADILNQPEHWRE
ncbi:MAG: N-acetyltransferase [Chloroflexi bacterium]|nr:N-acetyltransferase [Chloroflexota bacterium]